MLLLKLPATEPTICHCINPSATAATVCHCINPFVTASTVSQCINQYITASNHLPLHQPVCHCLNLGATASTYPPLHHHSPLHQSFTTVKPSASASMPANAPTICHCPNYTLGFSLKGPQISLVRTQLYPRILSLKGLQNFSGQNTTIPSDIP